MKIRRNVIRRPSHRDIALNPPAPPREPTTPENHSVNPDEVILECGGLPPLLAIQRLLQSPQAKLASPKPL